MKLSHEAGIKPMLGTEIRNGDQLLYILIAANNNGLGWIHEFLVFDQRRNQFLNEILP